MSERGTLKDYIEEIGELPDSWNSTLKGLDYLGCSVDVNNPAIGFEFAYAISDVWERWKDELPSPWIFACKVIDKCDHEHWLYPPSFAKHRDQLREKEREQKTCEA